MLLVAAIVGLTLATGYIHFWVGGTLLVLNAAGYFTLAALVVGATFFYRPALPLLLLALAGYAAVTIVGWLIMGPYFDVAFLAKGIEVALIASIGAHLWITRPELSDSLRWGRSIFRKVLRRRPTKQPT